MDVTIRAYEDADEAQVVALWREVFPDAPPRNEPRLAIRLKRGVQPELFLVAVAERRVVGTAMGGFDGHRGWLHLLAVDPRLRCQGIGAALGGCARRRGQPQANLQVRGDNRGVLGFYERLGYRVEDRVSLGKLLPSAPQGK